MLCPFSILSLGRCDHSQTLAQVSGLPNAFINKLCLAYTAFRVAHAYSYIHTTDHKLSYVRSAAWWAGNFTAFYGLWSAAKKFNGGL